MLKKLLYICPKCKFEWRSDSLLKDHERGCPNPECKGQEMNLQAQLEKDDSPVQLTREELEDKLKEVEELIQGSDRERIRYMENLAKKSIVEGILGYVLKHMKIVVRCSLDKKDTCDCPSCQVAKMREHPEKVIEEIIK